jgi:hypothetical protein
MKSAAMNNIHTVTPIQGLEALDGCNCLTASFRKICAFHHYPISEELLFGLGAGIGFVYWRQQGQLPFLGGRGNVPRFHVDLSARTGINIVEHSTSSPRVAEKALCGASMRANQSVCTPTWPCYPT